MISLVLIILAAIFKAIMDKLQFHFDTSIFSTMNPLFWDPSQSWKNKWKNGDKSQGEAFPLSSTVLVSLTDAWHLSQFMFLSLIVLAIVVHEPITRWIVLDFVILKVCLTATFEIFFSKIFHKGK